jgi:hypothetical protein
MEIDWMESTSLGQSYAQLEVRLGSFPGAPQSLDDCESLLIKTRDANPNVCKTLSRVLGLELQTMESWDVESKRQAYSLCQLLSVSRQYNLELCPKLLYSRGPLVELLIDSGVGKYMEFRGLENIYMRKKDGSFEKVPGTKEDIFSNDKISLAEKRRLMKFLKMAAENEISQGKLSMSCLVSKTQ